MTKKLFYYYLYVCICFIFILQVAVTGKSHLNICCIHCGPLSIITVHSHRVKHIEYNRKKTQKKSTRCHNKKANFLFFSTPSTHLLGLVNVLQTRVQKTYDKGTRDAIRERVLRYWSFNLKNYIYIGNTTKN